MSGPAQGRPAGNPGDGRSDRVYRGRPAEEKTLENADPIRRAVTVRSDPARAFELFTAQMGSWWPLDAYSRVVNELEGQGLRAERLEFQARMGGSILEHVSDGRILPWGEVIAWDPPHRVAMSWRPHSMPEPPTELEVTFSARAGLTLVELEHRGWERLSDGFRGSLYEIYVRGWTTTLGLFAAAADQHATPA
jgi:uncharacterized protein YndB with AHSA1/START domain